MYSSFQGNLFFLTFLICICIVNFYFCFSGDDIWKYVGKLSEAQRSMLDDRFKWKVSINLCCFLFLSNINIMHVLQAREMDKRKEGKPGEARAALKRFVRENGFVSNFRT